MIYFCCDERRRNTVCGSALNGIDYLDVVASKLPGDQDRQRKLKVHFLNPLAAGALGPDNVRIDGGERIRNVRVLDVTNDVDARVRVVEVDHPRDFSPYTLRLVKGADA